MMNHRREPLVAAGLLLPLLIISQSPVHPASSQVEKWIQLGTDSEDTAWSYVLLGEETVLLGANSEVKSGNIGANSAGSSRATVTIGVSAKVLGLSKVKGDYVWLKAKSEVWDVCYNQIKKGGNVTIHGSELSPLYLPAASLPHFPRFSSGTEDVTVNVGQIRVLDKGDYGDVIIKTNARLVFSGGTYNIESLSASGKAKLYFRSRSEVRIADRLIIGPKAKVGPQLGSGIDASDITFYVNGNDDSVKAVEGVNADIDANIYAPRGTIWLRTDAQVTGSCIARKIKIGENVTLTWDSAFADYAAADKLSLYFYNDGTHAYFNETLVANPIPSTFTYTVYLDKPAGEGYPQDFRLAYSSDIAHLERWDGSNWNYVEDIAVAAIGRSIVFKVPLLSIANPGVQEDTKVSFVQYFGPNSYELVVDRAPDIGSYFISSSIIPNLPWPTPVIWIPGVIAIIYLMNRRRSE